MVARSKYDLKGAQMLKVPLDVWKKFVKQFGDNAAEMARDCLDGCAEAGI